MFCSMRELRLTYTHATEEELEQLRQNGFVRWLFNYVTESLTRGEVFDDWICEFVRGLNYVVKSYPKYCTRGYAFTRKGHSRTTYDAGVSSSSGDDVYYDNIKEILEIQYPGMVCYISYPRVTYRDDPWITVTLINSRGRVHGSCDNEPLQPSSTSNVSPVENSENVELIVDLSEFGDDAVVHS
ncbi:hypothetical protein F2Q69_00015004 [Brassica cretica]|uniref:Uncharacterized protein n=1 Tax=Brassica cretica TaxID=69181 RepID=A0A8S9QY15_BRACR|nr:hypothetical protein F2Q69_00015004 [Brassica cretica]